MSDDVTNWGETMKDAVYACCLVGGAIGVTVGVTAIIGGSHDGVSADVAAGAFILSVGVLLLAALVYLDAEVTAV